MFNVANMTGIVHFAPVAVSTPTTDRLASPVAEEVERAPGLLALIGSISGQGDTAERHEDVVGLDVAASDTRLGWRAGTGVCTVVKQCRHPLSVSR